LHIKANLLQYRASAEIEVIAKVAKRLINFVAARTCRDRCPKTDSDLSSRRCEIAGRVKRS